MPPTMNVTSMDFRTISTVTCGFAFVAASIPFCISASMIGPMMFLFTKKSTIRSAATTK